jgi:hypothetical protein
MGSYGDAALLAVNLVTCGKRASPDSAWTTAVQTVFPQSLSLQAKGCPKGAFLGLCEDGLVKGIRSGDYTRSKKNKGYAIEACRLLRKDPGLAASPERLWALVLQGSWKVHNQQMDVVLALWNADLVQE